MICSAREAFEILDLVDPIEFEFESVQKNAKYLTNYADVIEISKRRTGRSIRKSVMCAVALASGYDVLFISSHAFSEGLIDTYTGILMDNFGVKERGKLKIRKSHQSAIGINLERTKVVIDY